ncbi:MAG: hypothetical protein IJV67_00155, partial [Clostridia bacterium]|nr:hypothetical protein [Clostridia bacterium]
MLIAFLFCLVLGRFFYVQVIWGDDLRKKAIDQWTRELPIVAQRGTIKDRNGVVLVENKTAYNVFVRPRSVSDVETVVNVLSSVFGVDRQAVRKKIENRSTSEYTIVRHCSAKKIEELLTYDLDGVYYSSSNARFYPYGELLAQTLGYVSVDGLGQSGIEKYYDKYLKGM